MRGGKLLKTLWRSYSARAGIIFLIMIVAVSIYAVSSYPLDFGPRIWNNPSYWADNPKLAPPSWIAYFSAERIPQHIVITMDKPTRISRLGDRLILEYVVSISYDYDDYPSFLHLLLRNLTFFSSKPPRVEISMRRPDNLSMRLTGFVVKAPLSSEKPPYFRYIESPKRVILTGDPAVASSIIDALNAGYGTSLDLEKALRFGLEKLLFGYPVEKGEKFKVLKGNYLISIRIYAYDPRDSLKEVKVVVGGKTYGALGTDALGRDLMTGLLFGFPIALLIGASASLLVTMIGATLGILSGYIGGKLDTGIQRLSDIILNMPLLPLLIFLTFVLREFGSRLLLIILVLIAFGWPGLTIVIRPMVMQLKSSPFIEAAASSGASKRWIMFKHIFPQLAPFILAQMVFSIPAAILAEAALSFLGLGDPSLPTWGQLLEHGFRSGAIYLGYWWWVLPPGFLIVLAAITFVLIAMGLEPMINPRLRRVV